MHKHSFLWLFAIAFLTATVWSWPATAQVADPPFAVEQRVPDWAKDAVWYQIFPERFRNGDSSNDPGEHWYENLIPWTADWWQTHVEHGEVAGQENFYRGHGNVWRRRYGGDIQGLIESLPYLRELGVNALYLNPVFKAESMHKYDAGDFRHIDDRFGFKGDIDELEGETDDPATWQWTRTDLLFLECLDEAKRQGFRVIIDGVFNHTGREHYAFQDVLRHGKVTGRRVVLPQLGEVVVTARVFLQEQVGWNNRAFLTAAVGE
jgi:cyclomaltodextrinase / maltogenic alpha-amylase / neopullulanase